MSSKYILQPDGTVISATATGTNIITENGVIKDIEIKEADIQSISRDQAMKKGGESLEKTWFNKDLIGLKSFDLETFKTSEIPIDLESTTRLSNLINHVESNENFNFIEKDEAGNNKLRTETDRIRVFKSFNSFLDIDDDDVYAAEKSVFANELELEGVHGALGGNVSNLFSLRYLFVFDYLIETLILLAVTELYVSIVIERNDSDVITDYNLNLGSYSINSLNEFESILDPYFIKVLNYPIKSCNTTDRLIAFFMGMSLYLSGDELFSDSNWITGLRGWYDVKRRESTLGFDILRILTSILEYTLKGLLQSGVNDKRIDLLMRKFEMEAHWQGDLYKAKPKDGILAGFMSQFKYYYFKFAIERMHVGLNSLRHYLGSNINRDPIKYKNRLYEYKDPISEKSFYSIKDLRQGLHLPVSFLANLALNHSVFKKSLFDATRDFQIENRPRIDAKKVKEIEKNLESEYVPFYFHDIRTNEIIAFHAFIDNLTDSFSPEYTSTSGFGRIDDVKSYVKTTRSIQLSFFIVSTSPDDFDIMWYQVNKLVAMCYPQWSDAFISDTDAFKYPFTQMPTASPLIRLRVGDLIKTNYSRKNLSRLHGLGDRKGDNALKEEILKNKGYFGKPDGFISKEIINSIKVDKEKELGFGGDPNPPLNKSTPYTTPYLKPGTYRVIYNDPKAFISFDETRFITTYKLEEITEDDTLKNPDYKGYQFKHSDEDIIRKQYIHHKPHLEDNEYISKSDLVMSPFNNDKTKTHNPFTRAYESAAGQGLAGFITNLNVNSIMEMPWETTLEGSKGPMMIKIDIGFAPTHDIPPGLDHDGMMRAPVYNIGSLMNTLFND